MDPDELKKLESGLLAQSARERDLEAQEAEESTFSVVTFDLGDERYGLHLTDIQEVLKPAALFPVPSTPEYIAGVINLRGEIVCVVDPLKKMGLGAVSDGAAVRIVVVRRPKYPVGVLVDSVYDVLDIRGSDLRPLQQEQFSDCITAEAVVGTQVIRLLDAEEVLKRE